MKHKMSYWLCGCDNQGCMGGGCVSWASLVLRLALALVFIPHGWGKLMHIDGVVAFFTTLAIPAPAFFAWVVGLVEFVGGLALLIGLAVPLAGTLLVINMAVAFTVASKFALPKGELELTLLAAALSLTLLGAGKYSASSIFHNRKPLAEASAKPM